MILYSLAIVEAMGSNFTKWIFFFYLATFINIIAKITKFIYWMLGAHEQKWRVE